jgi:hypothetical protein
MSFDTLEESRYNLVKNKLLILGWRIDNRLTSDDVSFIEDIVDKTAELQVSSALTNTKIDELSCEAYNVLKFQLMSPEERAYMMTGVYVESRYFSNIIQIIDEASLCFYRGYFTSSLAILFIAVEMYLINLSGWDRVSRKPSFKELKDSILNLPTCDEREEARQILNVIYSNYTSSSPTQFYFNRHGLLHGMRGPQEVDEMNCARIFQFFDIVLGAEGLGRDIIYTDEFYRRVEAYKSCRIVANEQILLKNHVS